MLGYVYFSEITPRVFFDKLDNSKHKMSCGCIKRTPTPHLVETMLAELEATLPMRRTGDQ